MDDTVESWVQLPACGACGRMTGVEVAGDLGRGTEESLLKGKESGEFQRG